MSTRSGTLRSGRSTARTGICAAELIAHGSIEARRAWGMLARRRALSVTLVAIMAFAASMTISLLVRVPAPRIHDEFSYLLAADTFARGRLTNPPHPLWVHFESFHINQEPTYQSKYPPGQGLVLAAGTVIGGHPVVGLWISVALACASICWMLQGWLPPSWALLGGFLAMAHPAILLRWGQTYWGGAVAVLGGALVFGAVRRIVKRPRVIHAVLLGAGFGILANSRPFEGLIASAPVAVLLVLWMFSKDAPPFKISMTRIIFPVLSILSATAAMMAYYNFRGTGNALVMPYQIHERTYVKQPFFVFRDNGRPEPVYRHEVLRNYYAPVYDALHSRKGEARVYETIPLAGPALQAVREWTRPVIKRGWRLWKVYVGIALSIPLLALPWIARNRWMRFALLASGILTLTVISRWFNPHYAAPITCLVFLFALQGMRHMRVWSWKGSPVGRLMIQATLALCLVSLMVALAQKASIKPAHAWSLERERLLAELRAGAERHLVVVRYPRNYSWTTGEWVYNEADIDGAKVVWAREMDDARNAKLLEYFKDRRAWLLDVRRNRPPFKLVPYSMP